MARTFSLYLQSLLYTAAGLWHFIRPATYLAIMPPWVPLPHLAVAITGVWEVAAGLALLHRRTRKAAVWALLVLLVAVFPANLQMALNDYRSGSPRLPLALLRLPLQVVLFLWVRSLLAYKRA